MVARATGAGTSSIGLYKAKEEVWFDDGREEELLSFVQSRVGSSGAFAVTDAQSILKLMDEYGVNHRYMMNIGATKGEIVTALISKHKPALMLEFGSYVGYSTLLFASAAVKHNAAARYVSFERSAKFARIAQTFVDLAGLTAAVRFVVGPSSKGLVCEHEAGRLGQADLIFLDHYKPAYVQDLKICESLGIIREGSVLAADNVIAPGNPTYLEYVRSSPEEKKRRLQSAEVAGESAGAKFPARTAHQYKDYEHDGVLMPGVPEIVYESRLELGQEPSGEADGVEVTICVKGGGRDGG